MRSQATARENPGQTDSPKSGHLLTVATVCCYRLETKLGAELFSNYCSDIYIMSYSMSCTHSYYVSIMYLNLAAVCGLRSLLNYGLLNRTMLVSLFLCMQYYKTWRVCWAHSLFQSTYMTLYTIYSCPVAENLDLIIWGLSLEQCNHNFFATGVLFDSSCRLEAATKIV